MKVKTKIIVPGIPRLPVRRLELQIAISKMREATTHIAYNLGQINELTSGHWIHSSVGETHQRFLDFGKVPYFDLRSVTTEEEFAQKQVNIIGWAMGSSDLLTRIVGLELDNHPRIKAAKSKKFKIELALGHANLLSDILPFSDAYAGTYSIETTEQNLSTLLLEAYNEMEKSPEFGLLTNNLYKFISINRVRSARIPMQSSLFAIRRILLIALVCACEEVLEFNEKNGTKEGVNLGSFGAGQSPANWRLRIQNYTLNEAGNGSQSLGYEDLPLAINLAHALNGDYGLALDEGISFRSSINRRRDGHNRTSNLVVSPAF